MTRLLYFTRTQEREVFVCFGMEEGRSLYRSDGKNMNGRSFNES